jgi:hypothetical protein
LGARAGAGAPGVELRRLRRRAALNLWAERLARAAMPSFFVVLAYLTLAIFGLGSAWGFLGSLALAAGLFAWRVRLVARPGAAEIDRRIEAASGLLHRPLAALADSPATANEAGAMLWALHQARMRAALAGAQAGVPAPVAAGLDPFSLRALLLFLLATGLITAGAQLPDRLAAAFVWPGWPIAPPVINAWITPPGYSGQPPLTLQPGDAPRVLAGSTISVILDGAAVPVRVSGVTLPAQNLGPGDARVDAALTQSGDIVVGRWWHVLARWHVTVTKPVAPVVTLQPVIAAGTQLDLAWSVQDSYGLSALTLALSPVGDPDALPEGADLPASVGPGQAALDVAASPYGGLTLHASLRAANLAGLTGSAPPQSVTLPPPAWRDPTALAAAGLRTRLALRPEGAAAVGAALRHLAAVPPSAISYAADIQLAALGESLALHGTTPVDAVARLYELIRQIEAGPDFLPQKAFAAAARALLAALAHGPPDDAALSSLLARLDDALAKHLAAIRPGENAAAAISQALDQLSRRIAAEQRAGNAAQAQTDLQRLAAVLRALQNAPPMTAAQEAQAQAAQQAAGELSQLLQAEAALRDATAQGSATAAAQAQLQAALVQLSHALAKAGLPNLPGLGQAGQAMSAAQAALAAQNSGAAQSQEGAAISALQQAAAALAAAQAEAAGTQPGGDAAGEDGDAFGNQTLGAPAASPAAIIRQKIIDMDADPSLPAATHQYLQRLLAP